MLIAGLCLCLCLGLSGVPLACHWPPRPGLGPRAMPQPSRLVPTTRAVTATVQRERRIAAAAVSADEVADTVEATLDRERVRRCLDGLTEVQHESITLAYYGGYTYKQVAGLLGVALRTIKTRIRDGLIRMRDCMGMEW